jgi:CRP-like cAMP-binding protein
MATPEVIDILRRSTLFGDSTDDELAGIAEIANERTFEAGQTILREGDTTAAAMWVILEGEVEVSKGPTVLATLGPGDYFGEMALIEKSSQPRSADVFAKTAVRALQITRWDLRGVIGSHPDLAMTMLSTIAERLRNTNEALSE